MKKLLSGLVFIFLHASVVQAATDTVAFASAVQPPVWITHKQGAEQGALTVTTGIQAGDAIVTGPGARAQIALADGSLIKLGENTTLSLTDARLKSQKPRDLLSAEFKLSTGHARYTTTKTATPIASDIRFNLARGLQAQVLNADIWMSVTTENDRVVQIDGKSIITPRNKPAMTLSEPNALVTDLRNPKDDKTFRINLAKDPKSLLEQTELIKDEPALQSTGLYRIALAMYSSGDMARERVRRYRSMGYPVDLQKPSNTRPNFRVVLDGFTSLKDARLYGEVLVERLKILNPQSELIQGGA